MLKWCAIYQDDPQKEHCTEERAPKAEVVRRFEDAKRLGMHNGRRVKGMWLIDEPTQQEDVIQVHGSIPMPIKIRHDAYLSAKKGTP